MTADDAPGLVPPSGPGGPDYLSKPFDIDRLLDLVDEHAIARRAPGAART